MTAESDARITLGMTVRACRMGFAWASKYGGFLRVTVPDENRIRLEFHPPELIPNNRRCPPPGFRIWWNNPEHVDVINSIPAIRGLRSVKRPFTIYVNDAGELIPALSIDTERPVT